MTGVRLTVNLARVTHNTARTLELCASSGLRVMGVTKGVGGHPEIARAMLAAGLTQLADSRLENVARLRHGGIKAPIYLIRAPGLQDVQRCVQLTHGSFNSSPETLRGLSEAATHEGRIHDVILMLDLETGREGCAAVEFCALARLTAHLPGLSLGGAGTYFDFASTHEFRRRKLEELVSLVRSTESASGLAIPVISGGATNVFETMVIRGHDVAGISTLRIGTTVLLGIYSSVGPKVVRGCDPDSMVLDAELIEIQDRGSVIKGLLAMGTMEMDPKHIFPRNCQVKILHATSDHTVVDLSSVKPRPRVGERLAFNLGYYALVRAACSPYVEIITHS